MSFSSKVKEELSNLNTYSKKDLLKAELTGYLLSSNTEYKNEKFEFITENEFNIERIYKILFKLGIEYEPEVRRKVYIAKIEKTPLKKVEELDKDEEKRALIRGVFLGSGSVNDPTKKYHLEILLSEKDMAKYIQNILKQSNIKAKILDLRNTVNRQVNCETANLTKTVNAAVIQIEAINFLKKMKKFEELPDNLIEIAELRVKYPEMSLKDLGDNLESPIGKSGVNHRLKKIIEIADEVKRGN